VRGPGGRPGPLRARRAALRRDRDSKAADHAGIGGTFGTIKRADGSTQATFDGHPLYTYTGDTAPGQTKGSAFLGRIRGPGHGQVRAQGYLPRDVTGATRPLQARP
jgi:hypothetical protein